MTGKWKEVLMFEERRLHKQITYTHQLHCSAAPFGKKYGPGCSCEKVVVIEHKRPINDR